jgi:hypothetical protein
VSLPIQTFAATTQILSLSYVGVLLGVLHDFAPQPLHGLVALALGGQLAVDVVRREDGLEVQPLALAQQPLVQHVLGGQVGKLEHDV